MADAKDAGKRSHPNVLIVEGNDDKFSVIGLMEHHVEWPNEPDRWPVFVELGRSAGEIVKAGYLSATMKAEHVRTVGVMLDADDRCHGRYQQVRQRLARILPDLPEKMPAGD